MLATEPALVFIFSRNLPLASPRDHLLVADVSCDNALSLVKQTDQIILVHSFGIDDTL